MNSSICGIDCTKCELNTNCKGCLKTNGSPFGGECVIAKCSQNKGHECCDKCSSSCNLKEKLIKEFNNLGIEDMEEITNLNALKGSFVNIEYTLANGQVIKFLDDNKIYLGNQICKNGSSRCYGIVADENYLLVCEYGINGSDPQIVLYKSRTKFI